MGKEHNRFINKCGWRYVWEGGFLRVRGGCNSIMIDDEQKNDGNKSSLFSMAVVGVAAGVATVSPFSIPTKFCAVPTKHLPPNPRNAMPSSSSYFFLYKYLYFPTIFYIHKCINTRDFIFKILML